MVNVDLKKLQSIELEIFKEFVRLCDKHNLTYSLAMGTAIGTVRHKGFIPWDDDIDIMMPRKDYEYFWRVAAREMNPEYFFQNYYTDKNCGLIYGKIRKNNTILSEQYSSHVDMHQGVWIDIFPYDCTSDDVKEREKINKFIDLLKNIYIIKCGFFLPQDKNNFVNKIGYVIIKCICLFINQEYLIKKLDKYINKFNGDKTKNVCVRGSLPKNRIIPLTILNEVVSTEFEGVQAKIVKEYDIYLRRIYGDYMQLPPIEKRQFGSCHFIKEFKENIE